MGTSLDLVRPPKSKEKSEGQRKITLFPIGKRKSIFGLGDEVEVLFLRDQSVEKFFREDGTLDFEGEYFTASVSQNALSSFNEQTQKGAVSIVRDRNSFYTILTSFYLDTMKKLFDFEASQYDKRFPEPFSFEYEIKNKPFVRLHTNFRFQPTTFLTIPDPKYFEGSIFPGFSQTLDRETFKALLDTHMSLEKENPLALKILDFYKDSQFEKIIDGNLNILQEHYPRIVDLPKTLKNLKLYEFGRVER